MYEYYLEGTTLAITVSLMAACFMMLGLHPRRLPFNAVLFFLIACVLTMISRYIRIAWTDVGWTKIFSGVWLSVLASSVYLNIAIWRSAKEDSIYDRKRLFVVNEPRSGGSILVSPPFGTSDRDIRSESSSDRNGEDKFETLSRLLDAFDFHSSDASSNENSTGTTAPMVAGSSMGKSDNSDKSDTDISVDSGNSSGDSEEKGNI